MPELGEIRYNGRTKSYERWTGSRWRAISEPAEPSGGGWVARARVRAAGKPRGGGQAGGRRHGVEQNQGEDS